MMMVVFVMIMIMIYDDNLTSHIAPNKFKMPVRAMYRPTLTYPVTSVNENIELFLILHCQSEPYPCSCNNCAFNSQSYPRLCCVLPKYSRCLLFESLDTSLHYLSFQSETLTQLLVCLSIQSQFPTQLLPYLFFQL